jgi:small subunit ribosomal protein S18
MVQTKEADTLADRNDREDRSEGRSGRRSSRDGDRRDERAPRGRFGGSARGGGRHRRRLCQFCVDGISSVDYKDTNLLRQYLSQSARILSRRKTGTCAKHQRMLSQAIKRARQIALLPYTSEHIRLTGGGGRE